MLSGQIIVLTDRPNRSRTIVDAFDCVAEYRVMTPNERWIEAKPILGVIADVNLSQPATHACLRRLAKLPRPQRMPLVFLARDTAAGTLQQAHALGATTCLPAYSEPRHLVTVLMGQICPDLTVADLVVQRETERTGSLLTSLFRAAEADDEIDLVAVEAGLDGVLRAIHEGGLTRWLDAVWAYDDATFQHCLLVAGLAAAFAKSLKFSKSDQHLITRAALVHDVGKAKIPLVILNKPGKLEPDEMAVMRTHAVLGWEMLNASGSCDLVSLAVTRHHHEMLDGTGYPDGLSSFEIADPIRLLTICDTYAALIERRVYRAPLPASEALRILDGMRGKLEGGLVQAFANAITMS